MTYTETDLAASIERLAGQGLAALTQDQLDRLDQFHSGGPEAVDRLLPGLQLAPGMTVLDVGSGLGGPARQVARSTGGTVVGVDVTPAYVEAARALTRAAGLSDQVSFVCGEIGTVEQTDFDAAYTIHVQMNVADKKAYFAAIADRLRPGARLAAFEVCRSGGAEPSPPLPWSLDGTDSFLATPEELRDTIRSGGFELLEWADETAWVRRWFEELGAGISADAAGGRTAGASPATLPALLTDGPTRMLNFVLALASGVVTVHRGSFVRAH